MKKRALLLVLLVGACVRDVILDPDAGLGSGASDFPQFVPDAAFDPDAGVPSDADLVDAGGIPPDGP